MIRTALQLAAILIVSGGCAFTCAGRRREAVHPLEAKFQAAGLIDIHTVDPTIRVRLVNADAGDNFFGEDFYDGLQTAYLQPAVAKRLSAAQAELKKRCSDCSLLVMDAARPVAVSKAMWDEMQGSRFEKYVANPAKGSMHNFGAAVDVTIVDGEETLLDMGFIPFYKRKLGIAIAFAAHKRSGLTEAQRKNRRLLKQIMASAGFTPLAHEWWHFNGFAKPVIRRRYSPIP